MWWVLEPILFMLVFYHVFSVGFRMGGPNFVPYLLTGLVAWKWFASAAQGAATVFISNQGLLSQIDLPKYVLIATTVIVTTLKFLAIFSLLVIFLWYAGIKPAFAWVYLLPNLCTLLLLIVGISAMASVIAVFIPNTKLPIDNALLLVFFMSGTFFDISELGPEAQSWLLLNPIARWLMSFRDIVLHGSHRYERT